MEDLSAFTSLVNSVSSLFSKEGEKADTTEKTDKGTVKKDETITKGNTTEIGDISSIVKSLDKLPKDSNEKSEITDKTKSLDDANLSKKDLVDLAVGLINLIVKLEPKLSEDNPTNNTNQNGQVPATNPTVQPAQPVQTPTTVNPVAAQPAIPVTQPVQTAQPLQKPVTPQPQTTKPATESIFGADSKIASYTYSVGQINPNGQIAKYKQTQITPNNVMRTNFNM